MPSYLFVSGLPEPPFLDVPRIASCFFTMKLSRRAGDHVRSACTEEQLSFGLVSPVRFARRTCLIFLARELYPLRRMSLLRVPRQLPTMLHITRSTVFFFSTGNPHISTVFEVVDDQEDARVPRKVRS